MTEPRLLPTLPGQTELALREVHRRRRRTALLGTSTTAAAVLVMAIVAGPSGRDALEVTPADLGPAPVASPSISAGSAEPTTSPTLIPGPRAPSPSASPTGPAGPALPVATAQPTAQSSTQAAARPDTGYRRRPSVTRTTKQSYIEPSSGSGRISEGGCVGSTWCLRAFADQEFADQPLNLSIDVCRSRSSGPNTLTFDTLAEMDMAITTEDDRELWRWSDGQSFADREHEIVVPVGGCVKWSLSWDTVLDDGRSLPPDTYRLMGHVEASEVAHLNAVFPFSTS